MPDETMVEQTTEHPDAPHDKGGASLLPYVAPFVAFVVLTSLQKYLGPYPLAYTIKIVVILATLIVCARAWRQEIRFEGKALGIGILLGLIGLPLWLGLDAITPPLPSWLGGGARVGYDPNKEIADPGLRTAFLAIRFFGLAVLVPILEEVFWRSFLLRYITDQNRWYRLSLVAFSPAAFFIVGLLFASVHPEYIAAFAYAALMAGILRWTGGSLFACIIAHAMTNLTLGIYILLTGDYKYW